MSPRRERSERPKRKHLPGIAEVRIGADEQTTQAVLEALQAVFHTTDHRRYEDSGYTYLQLDAGCTQPDD